MERHEDEQSLELEALASIYESDFELLGENKFSLNITPSTPEDITNISCRFIITLPEDYPYVAAHIALGDSEGVESDQLETVMELASEVAEQCTGSPSIFSIAGLVREWLSNHNKLRGKEQTNLLVNREPSFESHTQRLPDIDNEGPGSQPWIDPRMEYGRDEASPLRCCVCYQAPLNQRSPIENDLITYWPCKHQICLACLVEVQAARGMEAQFCPNDCDAWTKALPLHVVCSEPFLWRLDDIIPRLVYLFPEALDHTDHEGMTPLHIALSDQNNPHLFWLHNMDPLFGTFQFLTDRSVRARSTRDHDGMLPAHYFAMFFNDERRLPPESFHRAVPVFRLLLKRVHPGESEFNVPLMAMNHFIQELILMFQQERATEYARQRGEAIHAVASLLQRSKDPIYSHTGLVLSQWSESQMLEEEHELNRIRYKLTSICDEHWQKRI